MEYYIDLYDIKRVVVYIYFLNLEVRVRLLGLIGELNDSYIKRCCFIYGLYICVVVSDLIRYVV